MVPGICKIAPRHKGFVFYFFELSIICRDLFINKGVCIMKIVTASNGKKTIKMSKKEWMEMGKKAGWIPPTPERQKQQIEQGKAVTTLYTLIFKFINKNYKKAKDIVGTVHTPEGMMALQQFIQEFFNTPCENLVKQGDYYSEQVKGKTCKDIADIAALTSDAFVKIFESELNKIANQ